MLALLALQFLVRVVTGLLLIFWAVAPVSHICFPFLSLGIRVSVCREIIFSLVSLSTTIPISRYPHMDANRSRFFAVCAVTRIEIRRIFFLLMPQPPLVTHSHTGSGSSHCCRTVPARSLATADRSIGKSLRPDGVAHRPRVCLHTSCGSPSTPLTPAVPQLYSIPLLCSNSSPSNRLHCCSSRHAVTAFSSSSMVVIVRLHHSDRFARTRAVAMGGHTAFPHRATCFVFPYSLPR